MNDKEEKPTFLQQWIINMNHLSMDLMQYLTSTGTTALKVQVIFLVVLGVITGLFYLFGLYTLCYVFLLIGGLQILSMVIYFLGKLWAYVKRWWNETKR